MNAEHVAVFKAAGRAVTKLNDRNNLHEVGEPEILALIQARSFIRGYIHELTGADDEGLLHEMREALVLAYRTTDTTERDTVVKDLAEVCEVLTAAIKKETWYTLDGEQLYKVQAFMLDLENSVDQL